MTTMRQAARGLVERREETVESRHGIEASRRRLDAALERLGPRKSVRVTPRWREHEARALLDATYEPAGWMKRFLEAASLGMTLLVAATAWAVMHAGEERTGAVLLGVFTVLAILGLPLVSLALASQRDADEARIRKAIRVALLDEEERYPPAHRWEDEK